MENTNTGHSFQKQDESTRVSTSLPTEERRPYKNGVYSYPTANSGDIGGGCTNKKKRKRKRGEKREKTDKAGQVIKRTRKLRTLANSKTLDIQRRHTKTSKVKKSRSPDSLPSRKDKVPALFEARHQLPPVMPVYRAPENRAQALLAAARRNSRAYSIQESTDAEQTEGRGTTHLLPKTDSAKRYSSPRKSTSRSPLHPIQRSHPYASPELLEPSRRIKSPIVDLRNSLSKFSRIVNYRPQISPYKLDFNLASGKPRVSTGLNNNEYHHKDEKLEALYRNSLKDSTPTVYKKQKLHRILADENKDSSHDKEIPLELEPSVMADVTKMADATTVTEPNHNERDRISPDLETFHEAVIPSLSFTSSQQDLDDIVNDLYLVISRFHSEDSGDTTVENILSALRNLNMAEAEHRDRRDEHLGDALKKSRHNFLKQILTFTSLKGSDNIEDPKMEEAISRLRYNCLLYDVTQSRSNSHVADDSAVNIDKCV